MIRALSQVQRISHNPTIGEIREQLQLAIEIEHATIPAYLTALFSLKDGTNADASWVIRSVAIEEMLHMALASNVLNAIGGRPAIANPAFIPEYPTELPHFSRSPLVQIERFSRKALRTFIRIEWRADKSEVDRASKKRQTDRYSTIGEFYAAIEKALTYVVRESNESVVFSGDTSRQISQADYYGSEGEIIRVTNLETAIEAMNLIVEQGEGDWGTGSHEDELKDRYNEGSPLYFASEPGEERYVAHLYRFYEIYRERYYKGEGPSKPPNVKLEAAAVEEEDDSGFEEDVRHFRKLPEPDGLPLPVDYDAVWPIRQNPKAADYPKGSEIRSKLDDFNRAYTQLLHTLDRTFNGEPSLLKETVPTMYELEYLGRELCRTPSGDGKTTVGPSWEFMAP